LKCSFTLTKPSTTTYNLRLRLQKREKIANLQILVKAELKATQQDENHKRNLKNNAKLEFYLKQKFSLLKTSKNILKLS